MTPEDLGKKKMESLRKRIEEMKEEKSKPDPKKDNPPKIRGEENKHVTWGSSKRKGDYQGKHRKSGR